MNNVLHAANNCNVTSTVIPTDDSKFVIEAQGHDKQINSFVDWCNDNPYGGKLTEYTIVSYKKQN
ncbi:MAG: hypothetical protein K9H64_09625 [Bacteroidales bacterium]|nr:hypothetical protein [Bacteroidales bacterium]MCF8456179.1 hypothetical protein [Bacteroidales bacterium]